MAAPGGKGESEARGISSPIPLDSEQPYSASAASLEGPPPPPQRRVSPQSEQGDTHRDPSRQNSSQLLPGQEPSAAQGQTSRASRQSGGGSGDGEGGRRKRQPCSFFLKTGNCAFGNECKFEHPQDQPATQYNSLGLPLRPGEPDCAYYVKNLHCGYGGSCKFHHAEPVIGWMPMPVGGGSGGMVRGYSHPMGPQTQPTGPQGGSPSGQAAHPMQHFMQQQQQQHMQWMQMAAQMGAPVSPQAYPSMMGGPLPYMQPHPQQLPPQQQRQRMPVHVPLQMQSPPHPAQGVASPQRVDPRLMGGIFGPQAPQGFYGPPQGMYPPGAAGAAPMGGYPGGYPGVRAVGMRPETPVHLDPLATLASESSSSSRPHEGRSRSRRRSKGRLANMPIAVDALLNPERSGSNTPGVARPIPIDPSAAGAPNPRAPDDPSDDLAGLRLGGGEEQE